MPPLCHQRIGTYYHHLAFHHRIVVPICIDFDAICTHLTFLFEFESLLLRQGNPCFSRVSFFYATIMPPFLQRHNEGFHPCSAFFLHSYRNMRIFIHCECHCRMSEIGGDRLDIHAVLQRKRGIGVPLGYNNDKTGNPYGTRVLSDSGC